MLGVVAHIRSARIKREINPHQEWYQICKLSTREVEAGELLQIQGKAKLHIEFYVTKDYSEKPCLNPPP